MAPLLLFCVFLGFSLFVFGAIQMNKAPSAAEGKEDVVNNEAEYGSVVTEAVSPAQQEYKNLFGSLIIGLFIWIWVYISTAFLYDSGPSQIADLMRFVVLGAAPLTLVSLSASVSAKKESYEQAVKILKVPFYYAIVAMLVFMLTALLD